MPQELYVLRCYACKKFQVQIVKKVPKWQCKVCNEKQSVLKVYAQGSGKDCRQYVQDLNFQQGQLAAQEPTPEDNFNDFQQTSSCSFDPVALVNQNTVSKWSEYLEVVDKTHEDDNNAGNLESFQFRNTNSKVSSLEPLKVTKCGNYLNENEPESHFDIPINQNREEDIQEGSMKSKKRKFPEYPGNSDSYERRQPYKGLGATFPSSFSDDRCTPPHKNKKSHLDGLAEFHKNSLKKNNSKWSHYIETADKTSTLTLTEERYFSQGHLGIPASIDTQESDNSSPQYDVKLECTSTLNGNVPTLRKLFNSCENIESREEVSPRVPTNSINPFFTTIDDNLDSVLDF